MVEVGQGKSSVEYHPATEGKLGTYRAFWWLDKQANLWIRAHSSESGRELMLVELLAGEIEQRSGKKQEHDESEQVASGQGAKKFGTKGEKIRPPR